MAMPNRHQRRAAAKHAPVALPKSKPSGPGNAAIYYAADGYDPVGKGINGRRVAGESFLRGFFKHAEVSEFVGVAHNTDGERTFCQLAQQLGRGQPARALDVMRFGEIAPVDVFNYPSPNYATECWRRASLSGGEGHSWAICGITHTTATKAVMQGMFDLRAAPQMAWDAVICTSRAVLRSISGQMDVTDAHLAARFGGKLPPRPLLPVIPLGVHCDDHAHDPAARLALRSSLNLTDDDVLCATLARLSPHEKFDPLPLYLAMAQAQEQLSGSGKRLHMLLCGQFRDGNSRNVFLDGAKALMPQVACYFVDGGDGQARRETLSGADLFLFPIDSAQETFGLAPIEAMAAGLPVIVSDWDGMRDTVVEGVGIRIPTTMAHRSTLDHLALRYFGGSDDYAQYLNQLSATTTLDVQALTEALVRLGADPELRQRMGQAAAAHARAHYDWKAVIPQYQALWAEQSAILAHARQSGQLPPALGAGGIAPAPGPGHFFEAYPSRFGPSLEGRFYAHQPQNGLSPVQALQLRNYEAARRMFDAPAQIEAVYQALLRAGASGLSLREIAAALALPPGRVARILQWLLKYDFAREQE